MDKKILIVIIIVIVAIMASAGAYFFLNQENVPDFQVNGKETRVDGTVKLNNSDSNKVIGIAGANFSIPKEFEGNLSYQSGNPKVEFKNDDKYFTITYLGKGTAKEFANKFIEDNKGFSLGKENKKKTAISIEINQGKDVISNMYYVQIGEHVYDVTIFGLKLRTILKLSN